MGLLRVVRPSHVGVHTWQVAFGEARGSTGIWGAETGGRGSERGTGIASRYRQLGVKERVKIETLARAEHSRKSIARCLELLAQSASSREMGRDRESDQPYGPLRAQAFAAGH